MSEAEALQAFEAWWSRQWDTREQQAAAERVPGVKRSKAANFETWLAAWIACEGAGKDNP